MATEGIMKTTYIPEKKVEVTSTVSEFHDFKSESFVANTCGQPWLPENRKVTKTFKCEYPSVEPNVYRIKDPLPFPDDLRVLIGWTDAFVDRIASKTQECKDIMDERAIEIIRLNGVVDNLEGQVLAAAAEIVKERGLTAAEKLRADTTEGELRDARYESEARAEIIKKMEADAAAKADAASKLQQQLADLDQQLAAKSQALTDLQEAFKQADAKAAAAFAAEHGEHLKDHSALDKVQRLLSKQQTKTKNLEQELGGVRNELAITANNLKASQKTNKELNNKIDSQNKKISKLETKIVSLEGDVTKLKKTLSGLQSGLDASKKQVESLVLENGQAKERISQLDNEVKDITAAKESLQKTLNATEKELVEAQEENKRLNQDLKDANDKKNSLEKSLDEVKETNESDKKRISELETEAKKAKESKTKLDATLRETENDRLAYKAELEREKSTFETQLGFWKDQADEANARVIPNPDDKHINILTVEYGSKSYTPEANPDIFQKLYAAAEKKTSFKADNSLFSDPWHGIQKSCCITYQVDGKGAPRVLVGREGAMLKFE